MRLSLWPRPQPWPISVSGPGSDFRFGFRFRQHARCDTRPAGQGRVLHSVTRLLFSSQWSVDTLQFATCSEPASHGCAPHRHWVGPSLKLPETTVQHTWPASGEQELSVPWLKALHRHPSAVFSQWTARQLQSAKISEPAENSSLQQMAVDSSDDVSHRSVASGSPPPRQSQHSHEPSLQFLQCHSLCSGRVSLDPQEEPAHTLSRIRAVPARMLPLRPTWITV